MPVTKRRLIKSVKDLNINEKEQTLLEFYKEIFDKNEELLPNDKKLLLQDYNIAEITKLSLRKSTMISKKRNRKRDFTISTNKERQINSVTDVFVNTDDEFKNISELPIDYITSTITEEQYNQQVISAIYEGKSEIFTRDWIVKDRINHNQDFVDWIDSINMAYPNIKPYKKFNLYCQQAEDWYSDNSSITDYNTIEEQELYMIQEFDRCSDNTYYFVLKYGYMKEGDSDAGRVKYNITDRHLHQRILFFLYDSGYSLMIGKPRQGGYTTAFGFCAVKSTVFQSNHFVKYIAQSQQKTVEIFEDKIKYVFSQLPEWMKPLVSNDRDQLFKLGKKEKKGDVSGINSKIEVVPPDKNAINGGAPQKVFVDEIGMIGILTEMINEARPALFWINPNTKIFEMKRQLILFGTGGATDLGKGAFEREWGRVYGLWNDRNFESGIIPLFFNWRTRVTDEEYNSEKKYYYGGGRSSSENIDLETSKIQFHQHYPSNPSDMFLTTVKTLINRDIIENMLNTIRYIPHEEKAVYGYMQPIFDTNSPVENQDVPYKIVGSEFIPCDPNDDLCTTIIKDMPDYNFRNRYYQGTDPISNDTGVSKMASAIFDSHKNTISALVNFRRQNDPKSSFLQCALLGMFYDPTRMIGVPELLEYNIGLAYSEYLLSKGIDQRLIYNTELPDIFATGANHIGIKNYGGHTKYIIYKMNELFGTYGELILIEQFWNQLKTFICKPTQKGGETWEAIDKRYFYDDALFAATYAYIASLCYPERVPTNLNDDSVQKKKYQWVKQYDENYNLKLVRTTVLR